MSKRLTRKAIKQDIREDEFRSTIERLIDWFELNQRQVIVGIGAVLVLGLIGSVVYAVMDNRRAAGDEMLADAIKLINAPVVEQEANPDDPESPSFASADARRQTAKEAFSEVEQRGGTAGAMADLYLADIALEEGDTAAAREKWEAFLKNQSGHILATSVRLNLIRLRRETGEAEQVAEELQAQLDRSDKSLPEDAVLFELAKTLETLEREDEAQDHYQRILDEFPQSAFASQARQATTQS